MTDVASLSPARNPPWSRDELILALNLYVRHSGNPPGKASSEIVNLSALLNKIGRGRGVNADFRNANGVYMKAMNFRRFDPSYAERGRVGLQRGNKDEAVVWEAYAGNPEGLKAAADAIEANASSFATEVALDDLVTPEGFSEAPEGRVLTVQHVVRERSRKLVEAKKRKAFQERGTLACEACRFDFGETYGERGNGFIEVHHTKPVHTLRPGHKTALSDLALVCSNCHRMIHSKSQWLSMDELRSILRLAMSV